MERGSSKHGRILDEQMAEEAQAHTRGGAGGSRVDEWREPEPAGEDQPQPTWIPEGVRPAGAPSPLSGEDLEARSQLGRWVPRSLLPAGRGALIRAAEEVGAPGEVVAQLERLPRDREYATVYEIWAALGHENEPSSSTGAGQAKGRRP